MREEFFKQVCEILSHKFLAFPVKGGKTLGFMSNDLKHGENFALAMPIACTRRKSFDLFVELPPMVSCKIKGVDKSTFSLEEAEFQDNKKPTSEFCVNTYMHVENKMLTRSCDYAGLIQSCARDMYDSISYKTLSKMPKKQAALYGEEMVEEKFLEFLQSFDALECSFINGVFPINFKLPGYDPDVPCECGRVKTLRLSTKTAQDRMARQKLLTLSKGENRKRNLDGMGK